MSLDEWIVLRLPNEIHIGRLDSIGSPVREFCSETFYSIIRKRKLYIMFDRE